MENEDIEQYVQGLQSEAEDLRSKNAQLSQGIAYSSLGQKEELNLIEFQLDTAELINRLEHFLRGEYISLDDQGNEIWVKPDPQKDKDLISKCGWSPYNGKTIHGKPVMTFLRGQLISIEGEINASPGVGKFIKRCTD